MNIRRIHDDAAVKMTEALAELKAKAAKNPDLKISKKLLERYKRIVIVEELIDE